MHSMIKADPTYLGCFLHCFTMSWYYAKNNYKYLSTKNTTFGQSFFPENIKYWNKIDNETKESPTTLAFKNSLLTSHRQLYR